MVHGVLSKQRGLRVPRFDPNSKTWIFVKASANAAGPPVPSVTTLPVRPTALVADCEGCLLQVLTDFPNILDRIRMVYFENDGGAEVLRGVREVLLGRGMRQVVDTSHHKLFLMPRRGGRDGRRRGVATVATVAAVAAVAGVLAPARRRRGVREMACGRWPCTYSKERSSQ